MLLKINTHMYIYIIIKLQKNKKLVQLFEIVLLNSVQQENTPIL